MSYIVLILDVDTQKSRVLGRANNMREAREEKEFFENDSRLQRYDIEIAKIL